MVDNNNKVRSSAVLTFAPQFSTMKFSLALVFLLQSYILSAQQIFIPYRLASKWGLADTTGKVVMAPQFDTLEYEEYNNYSDRDMFFIAVKDGKKGLIKNIKLLINPLYSYIYINRYYFVCHATTGSGKLFYFYNLKGTLLNKEPFTGIDQVYHAYENYKQPVYTVKTKDGLNHLLYLDSAGNMKMLISNAFAVTAADGHNNAILLVQKEKSGERIAYEIKRKTVGDLVLEKTAPPSSSRNEYGFGDDVAVPPMDMFEGKLKTYMFMKDGDGWKSYQNYSKQNLLLEGFDTLYLLNSGYNYIYTNDAANNPLCYQNALQTKKNGLYGIVFPDGSTISNSYQSVSLFLLSPNNNFQKPFAKTSFLAKKEGKYGIIDISEKVLLPFVYDTITADLAAKTKGKLGILQTDGQWLLPAVYDSVSFSAYRQEYELKKDGKYGLLVFLSDKNTTLLTNCKSPYPLKGWKRFRTNHPAYRFYIVFEQYSPDGKFLGYYDKKGFAYYK